MKRFFTKFYFYLVLLFMYAPIVTLIVFSFNGTKSRGVWNGFSLMWYKSLFRNWEILSALGTTLIVALLAALIATVIGTVAAIALHNSRPLVRKGLISATYLPMVNSDIVTGVSLMLLFSFIGMQLGFSTLMLSHVTFCVPYVILSVLPKLHQINKNTFEAALDLGANYFTAYTRIIVPEIMPGILTGFLISVTLSIDDFMISFFNTGQGVQNLSILIYTMTKRGIKPEINALSAIMFAAVLVLLIIINIRQAKAAKKNDNLSADN